VCGSMLQRVAMGCSVFEYVALCRHTLWCPSLALSEKYGAVFSFECVAVCCSVLQCVAVLQCAAVCCSVRMHLGAVPASLAWVCCSVWQCVAPCCTVLQCADAPRGAVPAFPLLTVLPSAFLSFVRVVSGMGCLHGVGSLKL